MNNSFANQDPQDPFQQNQQRVNFRNGEHDLHAQSFYAWLHPDLRNLPGIDWATMPGTVTSYLVNAVGDSPYAPHIALAVGTALGSVAPGTLRSFAARLNMLLNAIRTHCTTWNGTELPREVWEEFVSKTVGDSRRRNCLLSYAAVTEHHITRYIQTLDAEQSRLVSPYVLPRLPRYFLQQYCSKAAASAVEQQQRREKNALLLTYRPHLIALIQLRKQAVQRLHHAFREACHRAESGEVLPLDFSYEAVLPEITREASSAERVQVEQRTTLLQFKLWNKKAWIELHPEEKRRISGNTEESSRGDDQPEHEAYFVQYLGQAAEFLWFGDLVEQGLLMRLDSLRQRSHSRDSRERYTRRLAYARALGVPQGFVTDRPGLLTPAGDLEEWLGQVIQSTDANLFDPESLYRGCLFGATLATLTLTNGSRGAELLQVCANRFKGYLRTEKETGQLQEKQSVIWYQHFLPKGKKTDEERQLFFISPQSYALLRDIGALLKETYGCIPVVYPHPQNPKRDELKAERYLFQWGASPDGFYGALSPNDVRVLIRFILHGLEFPRVQGETFDVSTHLLRHIWITAAWHEHAVTAETLAFMFHHPQTSPTIPGATDYYSRLPEDQRIVALGEFVKELGNQENSILPALPDERPLAQMHEELLDVLDHLKSPFETAFGFCGCVWLCPRGYNRNLCIGCPYLIPNSEKRPAAISWRDAYAEQASKLEAEGATDDARLARMQVQELDDLIRIMDVIQQAIDDGTYTPPWILPPEQRDFEEHLDA